MYDGSFETKKIYSLLSGFVQLRQFCFYSYVFLLLNVFHDFHVSDWELRKLIIEIQIFLLFMEFHHAHLDMVTVSKGDGLFLELLMNLCPAPISFLFSCWFLFFHYHCLQYLRLDVPRHFWKFQKVERGMRSEMRFTMLRNPFSCLCPGCGTISLIDKDGDFWFFLDFSACQLKSKTVLDCPRLDREA